jgi:hypothetical protein
MKITKGAKPASPTTAAYLHKVFGKQHEADRERAAKLRAFGGVAVVQGTPIMAPPFPESSKIFSFWGIQLTPENTKKAIRLDKRDDSGNLKDPEEGKKFYKSLFKGRNFYLRKKTKDTEEMRKWKTKGIKEHSVSLPVGWSLLFAEKVKKRQLPASDLADALKSIGLKLLSESAKRTGYEALYLTTHADSPTNVHFEFGLGSVDPVTHKLLGRSATGKRGKQGLREAGFDFLNTWRNSKHAQITPEEQTKFEANFLKIPKMKFSKQGNDWKGKESVLNGGFDDIALSLEVEKLLKEKFPDFSLAADAYAKDHSTAAVKRLLNNGRTHDQKNARITELTAELSDLKDKYKTLKERFHKDPFFGKSSKEVEQLYKDWREKIDIT